MAANSNSHTKDQDKANKAAVHPPPCPACTFQNGPMAIACSACFAILPDFDNINQSRWLCGKCTFSNSEEVLACEMCNALRYTDSSHKTVVAPTPSSASGSGGKPKPPRPPPPQRPPLPAQPSVSDSATATKLLYTSPSTISGPGSIAATPPQQDSAPRKGFNRQNSTLSQQSRTKHEERLTLRVDDVVQFLTESKTKFEDPEFPALKTSLFTGSERIPLLLEGNSAVVAWLRPNDIRVYGKDSHLNWTLFNNPASTDIVQGVLGNCWFASALSVLAENRKLLERIFVTKAYNSLGVYGMRLCKNGQWTDVMVDDRLPCLQDGSLAFCKAKRKQLWVPLLEKALAKIYGSYGALISGTTQEGLATLTGFPCESYEFESMEGQDMLWARLLSGIESNLLMGCSSGKRSVSEAEYTRVGLVSNHAYSILDVQLVHGERLLHLRNTWGKFSWTGDWCEYSQCWNVVPEALRNKLKTKGAAEGLFWISFKDWLTYFNAVYICFVREGWHETRIAGRFLTGHADRLTISRLAILSRTEVDLSLHQKSNRGDRCHDIVDLLILVYDDHWQLVTHSERMLRNHITCSTVLEPGYYNIYCLSFNQWLSEAPVEYTLVCHSHQPVYLEQVDLPKETASLALVHLALAKGESVMCDVEGYMYTYTLDKGWSGQITLAVNNHPINFFHIKTTLTDSVNLVSTRGITTVDVIPPRHRQIVNVSTQLEITSSYSLRYKQSYLSSMIPQPGWWGVSSMNTPPITSHSQSIHRVMSSQYF